MGKHKHYDLIVAWAEGAEIEFKANDKWLKASIPSWHPHKEYRVKPVNRVRSFFLDGWSFDSAMRGVERLGRLSEAEAKTLIRWFLDRVDFDITKLDLNALVEEDNE